DILQPAANNSHGLLVRSGTGGSNTAGFLWAGSNGLVIDSFLGNLTGCRPLQLRTGGADRLHISTDGNVGINTTTPSSRLDVRGTIRAEGESGTFTGLVLRSNATDNNNAVELRMLVANDDIHAGRGMTIVMN